MSELEEFQVADENQPEVSVQDMVECIEANLMAMMPDHFMADCSKPKLDAKKQPDHSTSKEKKEKKLHRKRRTEREMVAEENTSVWAYSDSNYLRESFKDWLKNGLYRLSLPEGCCFV
ncbi:hypothetical protein F511_10926 [Dorcoceras hygrometricum]|uniref:Uncharacterized protein n=1 Tax=Dorcoceras hygrometricum TaxID=472368 RepID=A0A2Z7CX18_9LAMI|nr:hypothetical protein F511_10926 [Dorcoceras hygrometricum]